ncbi:hypothetical protein EYC84_004711 [Monilinia fructicola]|uniref:Uncharacterized protein n=1 Tax=Monilinia fructicola TaxID=38448 RepID=A0A5M9K6A9_MONFR|nr:hypothetical protein EYC84_004711 [Monilinia fructicola]
MKIKLAFRFSDSSLQSTIILHTTIKTITAITILTILTILTTRSTHTILYHPYNNNNHYTINIEHNNPFYTSILFNSIQLYTTHSNSTHLNPSQLISTHSNGLT